MLCSTRNNRKKVKPIGRHEILDRIRIQTKTELERIAQTQPSKSGSPEKREKCFAGADNKHSSVTCGTSD